MLNLWGNSVEEVNKFHNNSLVHYSQNREK